MPIFALDDRLIFPPPELADENGVIAVGGDLSIERLLLGYQMGIFPWYGEGLPIIWHSPDPRMVLIPDELHVGRSLKKAMRKRPYALRLDTAFAQVIDRCADAPRPEQDGTWITDDMRDAYIELHQHGFAHSAEAWLGDDLVGGLYGVCLGHMFFGESMFADAPNASKMAFVALVEQLRAWGVTLIDCQVHTDHLARFGAKEWPRERYLRALAARVEEPTRIGFWRFPDQGVADPSSAP